MMRKSYAIGGPLGQLYGSDPTAFVLLYVKKNRERMIDLMNRCSMATGVLKWKVPDGDGGELEADMVPRMGDDAAMLAAKLALWATYKGGACIREEVKRRSYGLPFRGPQDASLDATEVGGDSADAQDWAAVGEVINTAGQVLGGLLTAATGGKTEDAGNGVRDVTPENQTQTMLMLVLAGVGIFLVAKAVK